MNLKRTLILACIVGALVTAGSLFAAASTSKPVHSDVPADLAKQAKISLAAARTTALAKVPGGEVRSEELEKEHGKLIYSFDIAVSGKSGVTEVNVSAISGKVLSVHHESARTEKKEEKKEHPPGR
jgi:uncharacterized membrane protein YkoI